MAGAFCWCLRVFLAPDMKRVCEDYITKQVVIRAVVDVQRGIELEIRCDVAGEADRR